MGQGTAGPSIQRCIPEVLLQPLPDGSSAGFVPDLPRMLSAGCAARRWDETTGRPTRVTLERLNLPRVADDLWGPLP